MLHSAAAVRRRCDRVGVAKAVLLAIPLVLLLALEACGGSDDSASLEGTSWTLVSLNGADPVPGASVTIEFAEGGVSGSGGCNRYRGEYTADEGELSFGPLASTRMACAEPVMAQETAFLQSLEAVTGYTIDGDALELVSGDGTLTFTAA
jgi:heat shock protein HslJ